MSELVLLHHNEPMTTSLAIAEGVQMEHKSVIQLFRTHLSDIADFGEVAFQMRLNPQGSPTEFVFLNEGQAMFLMTLMRNSEIVVAFKKALVKAFLSLRDRLQSTSPTFSTSNLSHGADLAVAADRTFRGFLRSARSAGLRLPQALQVANRQTIARTGMDMLGELGVVAEEEKVGFREQDSIDHFLKAWREGNTCYPFGPCVSGDLLSAYQQWCVRQSEAVESDHTFHRRVYSGRWLTRIQAYINGKNARVVMSSEFIKPNNEAKLQWYTRSIAAFRAAML